MSDIGFAIEAKSDQLNYDDIADTEIVITISNVVVRQGDQPVHVHYHGCNNRPWKPSKGMLRILAAAWGRDSANWIGRSAKLYGDASVKWAGKEVGGIRISALSDISENGINAMLTVARGKRQPYKVDYLCMKRPEYPNDQFEKALPAMVEKIASGEMSIEQVIARCQKTGDLTADQLSKLEQAVPVSADDEEIV